MKEIRERDIEKYLKSRVEEAGGEIRKVRWIGRHGAPDRAVFLNGVHFPELKAPGKDLEAHQLREHKRMIKHGAKMYTLNSIEKVDQFMEMIT